MILRGDQPIILLSLFYDIGRYLYCNFSDLFYLKKDGRLNIKNIVLLNIIIGYIYIILGII